MTTLPEDPYLTLGVTRDATAAVVKSAFRKAALKCHPDKVQGKEDEFVKIQQAYEILGDDKKRADYEDQVRLAELKKNVQARRGAAGGSRHGPQSPYSDVRTAAFDVRQSPTSMGTGFTARGPSRVYEEKRPSGRGSNEDDVDDYFGAFRASSRKFDGYEAAPRRPPPRAARSSGETLDTRTETLSPRDKEKEEERAYKKMQQQREQVRERKGKYSSYVGNDNGSSSGSDEDFFEAAPKRAAMGDMESPRYDQSRRGPQLSEDGHSDDRFRKLHSQTSDVRDYTNRARAGGAKMEQESPSPPLDAHRSGHFQDQYHTRRASAEARPSSLRRSSTRAKEKPVSAEPPRLFRHESMSRRSSDMVEPPSRTTSTRRPPTLHHSLSTPPTLQDPADQPRRSRTYVPDARPTAPPPGFRRAETMPVQNSNGSTAPSPQRPVPRRSDATPAVGSNLRYTETPDRDSGYSTSSPSEQTSQAPFPESKPPPSSFKYKYPDKPMQFEEPLPPPPFPRERDQQTPPATSKSSSRQQRADTASPSTQVPPPLSRQPSSSQKSRPTLFRSPSNARHSSRGERESPIVLNERAAPAPEYRDRDRERSKTSAATPSRRPDVLRNGSMRGSARRSATLGNIPSSPSPDLEAGFGGPSVASAFFEDVARSTSPMSMEPNIGRERTRTKDRSSRENDDYQRGYEKAQRDLGLNYPPHSAVDPGPERGYFTASPNRRATVDGAARPGLTRGKSSATGYLQTGYGGGGAGGSYVIREKSGGGDSAGLVAGGGVPKVARKRDAY